MQKGKFRQSRRYDSSPPSPARHGAASLSGLLSRRAQGCPSFCHGNVLQPETRIAGVSPPPVHLLPAVGVWLTAQCQVKRIVSQRAELVGLIEIRPCPISLALTTKITAVNRMAEPTGPPQGIAVLGLLDLRWYVQACGIPRTPAAESDRDGRRHHYGVHE